MLVCSRLRQPGLGAGLVAVAAGRTGDADAAQQGAAGLNHETAGQHRDMRQLGEARIHLT